MIARPELFRGRDFFYALLGFILLFLLSLSFEYYSYKKFAAQEQVTLTCKVLNQYEKHSFRDFYMLKLDCGDAVIYTAKGLKIGDVMEKEVSAEFNLSRLDFLGYLKGFYAKSTDFHVLESESFKSRLNASIATQHEDKDIATIYKALFTAAPQSLELRQKLSSLGVSHIMAISGFHLGVLSVVLFFLFGFVYKPITGKFFPYRNANRDLFVAVAVFLFAYVWFLDFTPSLIRSFGMLVVGYFLYDRGLKIISMQTLFLTLLLLVALLPKLLFSLAFWLSASGVFYIFLFALHTQKMNKIAIFLLFPIFVYMAMLPFSLYIFEIFSFMHPLSILWSELFTIFYPLSILLHVGGFGGVFDGWLIKLVSLGEASSVVPLSALLFYMHIALSFLAIKSKRLFYVLIFESTTVFIYAMQNVA
jgi:competence protein ComEC